MTIYSAAEADIVILGGTPAGITAAIAAARRRKSSIILERTGHIGGLVANGLGATDIKTRGATGGLFLEFVNRIKTHYQKHYGSSSKQAHDCSGGYHFEPSVAAQVLREWLLEYGNLIQVMTHRQFDFEPENVDKRDGKIIAIRVENRQSHYAEIIKGRFFLDCTYEGDLMAAAGVPFMLGREGGDVYKEVGAGRLYKHWNGPLGPGSTHVGDNAVQAYNYRLCLTQDPRNMARIPCPENYRRQEFASLLDDLRSGRHTAVGNSTLSQDQAAQNCGISYKDIPAATGWLSGIDRLLSNTALPNEKVDGNNQHYAFISTDLPEENWPYPTSGWAWRDAFAQRLREYTEGLFWFAQNDPEVPLWFRINCRRWGWAADEYTDNGHFPRQLYVREGRRMRGKYIFTANDVPGWRKINAQDSSKVEATSNPSASPANPMGVLTTITASHYSLDSHAARKREPNRVGLDGFFSYRVTPYSVPYGVMVPDAPITNLLCPVPVSASHVGFSTLRMEPCWMALGQAAGVAACLCLESGSSAEDVDMDALQNALLDQDAVLIYQQALWRDGASARDRKEMQLTWLRKIKADQAMQQD
ncbi:hypothetical protein CC79DRAFT_1368699 [Sarocladium strictum]